MKKINLIILILTFLFFIQSGFSQKVKADKLLNPTIEYEKDRNGKPYNGKMLNIFFADKVGTSFGGSNDLSLNKYFASLDNEDKSITLGINFDSRFGDERKKLTWLYSGSLKLKSANKFATIFDDSWVFQNENIGATVKVTLVGNGILNFTPKKNKKPKEALNNFRKINNEKYKKLTEKFNKEELPTLKKNIKILQEYDPKFKSLDQQLKNKQDELYIELAKDEIKYIEDNKMYNRLFDHWLSLEIFSPFGKNKYDIAIDSTTMLDEKEFYAMSLDLQYNLMWQWSSGRSIFLKASAKLANNNNILVDNLSANTFQSTLINGNNGVILNSPKNVYLTDYKRFFTPSFGVEAAFFFASTSYFEVGLSPSIEFNFGEYDKINWKFGIPISLKDKEGKPKVNFEFQLREQNTFTSSVHSIGLSTNFLFGDLIN